MKVISLFSLIFIQLFCFSALGEYAIHHPQHKMTANEMVALACQAKCEKERRTALHAEQLALANTSQEFSGNREIHFSYASQEPELEQPTINPEVSAVFQKNPEIATLVLKNPESMEQITRNPAWLAAFGIQSSQPNAVSPSPMTDPVAYAHCVRSCEMGLKESTQAKEQDNSLLLMMLGGLGSSNDEPPNFYQDLPSTETFLGDTPCYSIDY